MSVELDIEHHDALLRFLRKTQRLGSNEAADCSTLQGGVSNRTVLVERAIGESWVIKQALPKLRVAEDWFSDPDRNHREALGLIWLARFAPSGSITPLVFEDRIHHLLAMQAVPRPHANWKTQLLAGQVEPNCIAQFGRLLGTIHHAARERHHEIASLFADRTFFETLRLEPYYRFGAAKHHAAAGFLNELISDTLAARITLVHGDYSPKNILIHQGRLILLDHEVIHFGDPAFDLGFSLTHLLSKAHHLAARRADFLQAARWYWEAYRQSAGEISSLPGLEGRAVRHTLACLLARVDGRSPLEYLTPAERDRQRELVLSLVLDLPGNVLDLIDDFGKELGA